VVKPLALPDIDARLLLAEPDITCLHPGKDKYPVEDLEAAHDCERNGRLRARGRLHSLQGAVKDRQAIANQAASAATQP